MTISSLKNKVMKMINQVAFVNTERTLIAKLNEETLELSLAIRDNDIQNAKEEVADVLIVLVQIMELVDFKDSDLDDKIQDVQSRYHK